jgi:hypothetical protein
MKEGGRPKAGGSQRKGFRGVGAGSDIPSAAEPTDHSRLEAQCRAGSFEEEEEP